MALEILWYDEKNIASRANILNANIECKTSNARKGIDNIPLMGASCGTIDKGPVKKNLLIPRELVKKLRANVMRGSACEKSLKEGIGTPALSFGKNDSVVIMMAYEMFT